MAKRRRKTARKSADTQTLASWVWMLFGLAIGLAVAAAIYINDRRGPALIELARQKAPVPASPAAVDRNGEASPATTTAAEPRFTFYEMLPNFEVVIAEQEPEVTADRGPQAVVEPGVYVLQAGSFSTFEDADRRRAELALHGIESQIQRVTIDERTYHRVRIGPIEDLDKLNVTRSRLRQARIDVLRIRLAE